MTRPTVDVRTGRPAPDWQAGAIRRLGLAKPAPKPKRRRRKPATATTSKAVTSDGDSQGEA